jgi:hypothetical protein
MKSDSMSEFNKDSIYRQVSQYYAHYLNSLDWQDEFYVSLQLLMRNKFMTLAYYRLMGGKNHKTCSAWVTSSALEVLRGDTKRFQGKGLWLEHVIPKQRYITNYCESVAREREISADEIFVIMQKYFILATITKDENDLLDSNRLRNRMPAGWVEGDSVFGRYERVGIDLLRNPFFGMSAVILK